MSGRPSEFNCSEVVRGEMPIGIATRTSPLLYPRLRHEEVP
jgi:hypothetical protein